MLLLVGWAIRPQIRKKSPQYRVYGGGQIVAAIPLPRGARFQAQTAEGRLGGERVLAMKPTTFMNGPDAPSASCSVQTPCNRRRCSA